MVEKKARNGSRNNLERTIANFALCACEIKEIKIVVVVVKRSSSFSRSEGRG